MKEMEGDIGGGRARVEVEAEEAMVAATLAATMAVRRLKWLGGGSGGGAGRLAIP